MNLYKFSRKEGLATSRKIIIAAQNKKEAINFLENNFFSNIEKWNLSKIVRLIDRKKPIIALIYEE